MSLNAAAGLSGMLKDGHQHYFDDDAGESGAVVARSITAACELSRMLSSSLGPQGRCKLVVNHLEKIIVTSDCASILKEVDVQHPAAKLLELAVQQQETEWGDATNLTVLFAGELLQQTMELMRTMGWKHSTDILEGYHLASTKLVNELLPSLVVQNVPHPASLASGKEEDGVVLDVLKTVLGSKQYGTQDVLAPLVKEACSIVWKKGDVLSAESIRTVKILGGSLDMSCVVKGFVTQRGVETTKTKSSKNAKIAIFACGMEASATEAKGTILMKSAQELKAYNKTEETKMDEMIKGIAETGVEVVATGGTISDMALHFLNRYNLIAIKIASKWELRRLCQATNSTALVRIGPPTPEEIGTATVTQKVVSGRTVTVFEKEDEDGGKTSDIATIVLRASTSSVLADLERAIDDGVHAVETLCKDGRLVYGGGATEMACSVELDKYADQHPGLEQYAIRAFAKSLECVSKTLAENAGWDAVQVVANQRAAHATAATDAGITDIGIDIRPTFSLAASSILNLLDKDGATIDPTTIAAITDDSLTSSSKGSSMEGIVSMKESKTYDLLAPKSSAFRLAVEAAMTVLKVDQIIMSKPSGGPSMPGQ